MAEWTPQYENWLSWAVKKLTNQGHLAANFLPKEDPAPSGEPGALIPSHVILATETIIGDKLPVPPAVLTHLESDGIVQRFGDATVPPCFGIKLTPIPTVPDNQAWVALDGTDLEVDELWAAKAPAVGFIDAWADGNSATTNNQGLLYRARFWYGDPEPEVEILPGHAAGPLWDASTGVLIFAEGDPYQHGIPENASIWFTGYRYVGRTAAQILTDTTPQGGVWNKVEGVVPSGIHGVGSVGVDVSFSVFPHIASSTTLFVVHNGVLLFPLIDFAVTSNGDAIVFTQTRTTLEVGDEIQILYIVS